VNPVEFAQKIQLHPRATVLLGVVETRTKNKGALPGLSPHYAMTGCPLVHYAGSNATAEPNAAEIEFLFQETAFPLPSALSSYSPRQGNLVQLTFGRNGEAPTQAAYRVLREASGVLNQVGSREVFLVSLPILTPGQYGVMTGRQYFLGLFNTDGTPIYLHPDAVDQGVFKAPFPIHQSQKGPTTVQDATTAPGQVHWYQSLTSALSGVTKLKGKALHETVLKARAQQLVDQGVAPSLEAGVAIAKQDLPAEAPATAAPAAAPTKATPSTRQLGAAMRGRSNLQKIADGAPPAPAEKTSQPTRQR
jgi:hypothetical protein